MAERYGTVWVDMECQGKMLVLFDLLIAAHALGANTVLVTSDRAFKQVAGLSLEDWTA
ncbi:MAG: PIN domain-containing protein [Sulfuriferula sp.]